MRISLLQKTTKINIGGYNLDDYTVSLTLIDKMILESYKTMLEGLADYLGEGCEIVLHSLESMEHSVIKIINGHHTGRKEGAPITNLALSMLSEIQKDKENGYISYFAKNNKGEPLKASTIVVKGEGGKAIGLLCINFYLNTPFLQLLSTLSPSVTSEQQIKKEAFVNNADELIQSTVARVKEEVDNDEKISASLKNREIIARLYRQGVFELKDSVVKVAECIGISKNTVYLHIRHLQEAKKNLHE